MAPSVRRIVPLVILALTLAGVTALADVKFTSTFAAPEARGMSFKGRKVAALVISDDLSLRMSG